MKLPLTPIRIALALALLLATSAISLAWYVTPGNSASEALQQPMHQIDGSTKVLGKDVNAENRAASLEELTKLQTAVMTAKALTPDSAAKVDEKKRAAFANEFRLILIEALTITCSVEIAIVEGRYKEADTLIRNKLGGIKSKGHGKYKTDGGN